MTCFHPPATVVWHLSNVCFRGTVMKDCVHLWLHPKCIHTGRHSPCTLDEDGLCSRLWGCREQEQKTSLLSHPGLHLPTHTQTYSLSLSSTRAYAYTHTYGDILPSHTVMHRDDWLYSFVPRLRWWLEVWGFNERIRTPSLSLFVNALASRSF